MRPWKTEGVGNAGCPMHPQPRVRNKTKHTSVVAEGSPDSPGIPARNGFNGLFRALPGERIRLVTVISGLRFCRTRSGRLNLRKFNTSNGCQDHTALPSAYSAVRQRAVNRSRGSTRPAIRHTPDAAASTASRPASVTIAIRPSGGWDVIDIDLIWGKPERNYFCKWGWTGNSVICPSGKSADLF